MKKLILLAGAAALAFAGPALAKPGNGNGKHGKGHSAHKVMKGDRYSGGRLWGLNARGSCPPGLAKKGKGCMPPGQAKKMYDVGDRYRRNFGSVWGYNQIPGDLREQYRLNDDYRYYYNDGYLYQVNPTTMLIQQVISAIL